MVLLEANDGAINRTSDTVVSLTCHSSVETIERNTTLPGLPMRLELTVVVNTTEDA